MLDGDAASRLAEAIDEEKPDILFAPFVLDDNDDHRLANVLLVKAAETGMRWRGVVWAYSVYSMLPSNVLVPLGGLADRKRAAINLYQSQAAIRDWASFALGLNAINARFTPRACKDTHLEAFLSLPLAVYLDVIRRWPDAVVAR
jgi:LmbE family N-acetylglucosaminyl deacetylase